MPGFNEPGWIIDEFQPPALDEQNVFEGDCCTSFYDSDVTLTGGDPSGRAQC